MDQDAFIALVDFLLADELHRVAQALNRRLDRRLDVFAFELQAVDAALNVLEPRLRFLEKQVGSRFGFAHDSLGLLIGLRPDIVGEPLRRQHGRFQILLELAVLVESRLHLGEILAQPIRFTERLLVIVSHGGQAGGDLDFVEAAERGPESLLSEVEGADVHTGSLSYEAFPLIGWRLTRRQRWVKHNPAFQKSRFRRESEWPLPRWRPRSPGSSPSRARRASI